MQILKMETILFFSVFGSRSINCVGAKCRCLATPMFECVCVCERAFICASMLIFQTELKRSGFSFMRWAAIPFCFPFRFPISNRKREGIECDMTQRFRHLHIYIFICSLSYFFSCVFFHFFFCYSFIFICIPLWNVIDADLIENFIAFGIFGKQFNIRAGRNIYGIYSCHDRNKSINQS